MVSPHSPMSFTIGTMRVNSELRNFSMKPLSYIAVAHSSIGSPRFCHSSTASKRSLIALLLGELGVVIAQRQPPERDMARLVLHHVGVDLGAELVLRLVADLAE